MAKSAYTRAENIGYVVYWKRHGALCELLPATADFKTKSRILYNAVSYDCFKSYTVGGTLFPTYSSAQRAIVRTVNAWNASVRKTEYAHRVDREDFVIHKIAAFPTVKGIARARKLARKVA